MEKTFDIQNIKNRYGIVGNSEGLLRAIEIALTVAPRDLSVLIIGESGVGKEVIPRLIHDNSARKHNKYFAINCGSIPEGTIDSELFGHAKGAFTGAIGEREGYFGAADGGTLFLDEVGELPLATQARLLRVLESGDYIRVGENTPKKTNVRIVAATNVNIEKAISEGKFRRDLYYRLNTIPISLPPLRERGRDVEMLFRKFASDISQKYQFEGIRLDEGAKDLLLKYSWPGNIRQLRNLTEQLSVICTDRTITRDILSSFGITDDSKTGSNIIAQDMNKGGRQDEFSSAHLYSLEREQILKSIKTLAEEIQDLRKTIYGMHQPIQGAFSLPVETTHAETKLEEVETMSEYNGDDDTEDASSLSLLQTEKKNIIKALERSRNNRRKAAAALGISERTLYRKIKEFGLDKSANEDNA